MAKIAPKGNNPKVQKPIVKNPGAIGVPKEIPKNENIFIYSVLAAYFVIGLIGVFHHEMWRDEMQTWLVGASSNSFGEFLHNMKGESNPLLWYTINFILSRFTASPVIAQIFHFLISVASVYLILKYAPFSRIQKVLLSFSYFVFFEYALIARGYALTVFFIFLFCVFYQIKSKNRYLVLSLILFFLANTTGVHGVIITLSLLGMMVVDYYYTVDTSIRKKYKPMQLFIGVAIALIGIYIAIKCISPPTNSDRSNQWFTSFNLQRLAISLRTFWMSFLPIPNMSTVNFWNTNIFFNNNTSSLTFKILLLIAFAIFGFCVLIYSKKASIAVFYLAATCGIFLLSYSNNTIYYLFAARYYGFFFIVFAAAAWLASDVKQTKLIIPGLNSLYVKAKPEKYFTYLLTGLFAINALGGVVAYSKDYSLTFSNIELAGNYITSHHLDKLPETGFIDYAISPISAYTKQAIYFPDRDTTGRFTTWGVLRFSFGQNRLLKRTIDFISSQKDSVLFITTGDYFGIGDEKVIDNVQFTRLVSFSGSVVIDEAYNIYIAKKFDLDKLMQDPASFSKPEMVNSMVGAANNLLQNDKLDEAEEMLLTIEEKTHGMAVPHLHNYLGMVYFKENKPADAEKEFNTEITLNLQKEEAFFNLGMLYFQNKDYDKAIVSWDSTVAIDPKNADAYNNIGVCYLNFKKDNTQAMTCFEKAVEMNANYTQGYINILVCAQNMNDEQTMIKYIRILLDKGTSIDDIKSKGINISDALLQKINAR